MRRIATILPLLLMLVGLAYGQQRVDPRHPNAFEYPESGRMIGLIDSTKGQIGLGEQFGYLLHPLGDVNHDGLADWLVGHVRIDSIQAYGTIHIPPIEHLPYKGVRGGLPTVESGVRVGPTELFCETTFLAAGDFDGDANRDIVMLARFWGDTSFNNHGGKALRYVIVYWGNETGTYSNSDTSRLVS